METVFAVCLQTAPQACTQLTLENLTTDTVRRFLDHLERDRHNAVSTRNNRLAAIHSFFGFLADTDPRFLEPPAGEGIIPILLSSPRKKFLPRLVQLLGHDLVASEVE
jgi:hypothetical protein